MNAAISIRSPKIDRASDTCQEGMVFAGTARHVSIEGCQFVIVGETPAVGCRFSITVAGEGLICGVVSWVVGARIGFGFGQQIGPATMSALSPHLGLPVAVRLLPCSVEANHHACRN